MRINFLVNEVFDGWEPTDTRLGGTERAVVEWAEELALSNQVQVFRNPHTFHGPAEINRVAYAPREMYVGGGDVCINIKAHDIAPKEPTIYYTNDVDADKQDLSAYGAIIHISNWAKDNIPVNNPNVFVVPHGIDPKIGPGPKIQRQCLYASSPDRGLDTLLEAWPKVTSAHPDATLLVTYGGTGPALPGVTYFGEVDEEFMNELYRTTDIWCHPCNGGELYCITGIKAQAAHCWPVIIPTMALAETVKYGTFATKENYAEKLIEALSGHPAPPLTKQPTIQDSTNELLKVVDFVLERKT